ncbi:MAG: FtsX-like permease family protein [Clostridia bacterium]
MKIAADKYYNAQNLMDFKLLSTYGITYDDISEINKMKEVKGTMPSFSFDSLVKVNDKEIVSKINTFPLENIISGNEGYINKVKIINGTLPKNVNECVVEESFLTFSGLKIGDKIELEPEEDFIDKMNTHTFTIVGTVASPYYMTLDKGSSKLGNGKVNNYIYILDSAITSDVYTEVFVTINRDMKDNTYYSNYSSYALKVQNKLEELAKIRKDVRYDEIVKEANDKINDAKIQLSNKVKEANDDIISGETKLNDGKAKILDGQKAIKSNENKAYTQFKDAKEKIDLAENTLSTKEKEFVDIKSKATQEFDLAQKTVIDLNNATQFERSNKQSNLNQISNITESIKNKTTVLNKLKIDLNNASGNDKIDIQNKIDALVKEIDTLNTSISDLTKQNYIIDAKIKTYEDNISNINNELVTKKQELLDGENLLLSSRKELNNQKLSYDKQKKSAYTKIANAKVSLENSQKEVSDNEIKINDAKVKLKTESEKAEIDIKKAEDDLSKLKKPKWYLLGRDKLRSYVQYEQDANRIASLSIVFPVVFFLVAALVSLTSMTRMVEEQRSQIGIFKALGYNKKDIASKYLWYSTLAAIFGSLIGILIGFNLIPTVVFKVYGILYKMPDVVTEFNVKYAVIAVGLSILCTTIAALMACIKELKVTPAALMRPKSPKIGKRVFLERIGFIWSKLNFIHKVTARNIFRYKKRLFMTVIGIAGCTSLLLAAFGLKDSVLSIAPIQYGDIFKYHLQISLKDKIESNDITNVKEFLDSDENIKEFIFSRNESVKCNSDKLSKDVQLITIPNDADISKYIDLKSRTKKEKYVLNDESVIITEQLSKQLDVKVGDIINLKFNEEDIPREVKISAITQNYVSHYVYMTENLYTKTFANKVIYNNIYSNLKDVSLGNEIFISQLLKNENINNANLVTGIGETFKTSMNSLNYVVLVLIIAAGLLALVVLYNLSNVNISERIRELATIKVLGFYDKEVSSYVDRESIILTLIGIGLGLILGQFLNYFIIITCESDMAMLVRIIKPMSFVLSALITIGFSTFVNILTHFSLKKIDMIESLKSVE